jgi:CBS domain-containing protein
MQIQEVLAFLQENPPFQNLDAGVLEGMQGRIGRETYPKGTVILYLDRPAGDFLRVIRKGAVKILTYFGQDSEVLTDYRGEGEIFGFLSLLTGNRMRAQVTALEDTTCFLIDRETFFHLLRTQPAFAEYLFAAMLRRYWDKPQREQGKRKLLSGRADRLLFTTPIGELLSKNLISASEDISIREASEIMSRNRISSLVLLDPLGLPTGIITANDLRDKVVSKGRDPGLPVKRVQSVSLVRVEAADHCIEALFKMLP